MGGRQLVHMGRFVRSSARAAARNPQSPRLTVCAKPGQPGRPGFSSSPADQVTSRTTDSWPTLEPEGSCRGRGQAGRQAVACRVEGAPQGHFGQPARDSSPQSPRPPQPQTATPRAKIRPPAREARQPCARASPTLCAAGSPRWQPCASPLAAPIRHTIQCSVGGYSIDKAQAAQVAEDEVRRRRRQAARPGASGAASSATRRQRRGESVTPTEAIDRGRGEARRSPSESSD